MSEMEKQPIEELTKRQASGINFTDTLLVVDNRAGQASEGAYQVEVNEFKEYVAGDAKRFLPPTHGTAGQLLRSTGDGGSEWGDAASPEEIAEAVTDWLDENVPTGETLVVDESLTIEGTAADAKVAGEKITATEDAITDLRKEMFSAPINYTGITVDSSWTTGSGVDVQTGGNVSDSDYCRTGFIAIKSTTYIHLDSETYDFNVWEYTSNSTSSAIFAPKKAYNDKDAFVTFDQNAIYFRIGARRKDLAHIQSSDITALTSVIKTYAITDPTLLIEGAAADAKVTGDKIADLRDDFTNSINEVSVYEDTYGILLTRGMFQRDVYNPSTGEVNNFQYRISSRKDIRLPYAVTLTAKTGFRFYLYVYNDSLGTYSTTGWKTSYNVAANIKFYIQIGRTTDDTSEVADVPTFLSAISVTGNPLYNFMTKVVPAIKQDIRWEQGGYTTSGSYLVESTATDRVRTQFFHVQQNIRIFFKSMAVKVVAFFVNPDGTYKGAQQQSASNANTAENISNIYVGASYKDYTFALVVVKIDGSALTPADVSTYVDIEFQNDDYVENGKQVLVYKFGGSGNDWCFVRTPANYNQFRVKPYPFVICNHGNGWVMNGSMETANWTKRTMYVPLDDPDYIANPDQYNGTDDESLWYSNPTIEALLSAGYVVCGCENYADLLYGNNNCRNACVDFFFHMINRYNVEKRCYMIGASNGALTSLNASYLLPGRIKAMVLQYPVTCLVNQYSSNSSQQAGIRSAYGITDPDISLADLAIAVETHDPLTTDVVDSKKIGSMPPVKLWYSQSDTAVNYQQNTVAFATLLQGSGKVVETVQASGQHGDYTHFDPAAFVAWFEAN